ncbi:hypothetical protein B0H13DRAFT_1530446, partial [Mycena leptocephala]
PPPPLNEHVLTLPGNNLPPPPPVLEHTLMPPGDNPPPPPLSDKPTPPPNDHPQIWTEELGQAHTALELGRGWGVGWAKCVGKFFDFEGVCGFTEGSWQMGSKHRPAQVATWLGRRKWTMGPTLGTELGTQQEELWAGKWWKWWVSLQPGARVFSDNELSKTKSTDWSVMAVMCRNNRLMQVIATLLLWGQRVEGRCMPRKENEWNDWLMAVSDVTWVLEQIL